MSQKLRGESICKAFDDALELLGGIKGMAKVVGVSESHIRRFRRGDYKMKLEYTMKIEAATKGKVKASDLAPVQSEDDKFGKLAKESESDELLSVEETARFLERD